jgi:para-aminobenzoate synthetase/4-amino-4-deoxychorismate lyase
MSERASVRLPPVLLQTDTGPWTWDAFDRPVETLAATSPGEVVPLLLRVERAAADGLVACGFLSYEAAPAFDAALVTHPAGDLPLAWFALFDPATVARLDRLPRGAAGGAAAWRRAWRPTVSEAEHASGVARIREWIAAGETYQLNYTLRLRRRLDADPAPYFLHLARRHGRGYAAWIDTGRHALCSLSPELFFRLDGERVTARPMKGTAPRGRTTAEDLAAAEGLRRSPKDRAENVMIVDMVRNDLSRIARPRSVAVPSLWDVERYSTLFQMTSTCEAASDAPVVDILAALFPSASITGAPKVRTMQLIRDLETEPRGIYTGAIGTVGPGRRARFSVAIRTVHVDRETGRAEYGTGGGVVWDSRPESEYAECLTKALVVTTPEPEIELVETLRWEPRQRTGEGGWARLERHLARLADSAAYFGWPLDADAVRERLEGAVRSAGRALRVRLRVARDGSLEVESRDLEVLPEPRRLALAAEPVDSRDRYLFHKTTHRAVYERARASAPHADDVLLWNERDEITESTIANLVLERGGALVTPALDCGLLPGALRAELLDLGRIREEVVTREALASADALYLISSVRGWLAARLS